MSTRVQKGGTVFRPVARPRARPGSESRQTSAVPESQSSFPHATNIRHEGSQASASSSSMPPPTHIPSKPVSGSFSHHVDASRGPTPTSNVTGPCDQENNVPQSSAAASAIAVPSRNVPRPTASPRHESREPAHPLQPVPSNSGTAISVPSRAVPVVVSQSRSLPGIGVGLPAVPADSLAPRQTVDSQDPPQQSRFDVTRSNFAHAPAPPTIPFGSFDMSQIDPSLQSSLPIFPTHDIVAPPFVEGSSSTLAGDGATHAQFTQNQVSESRDEQDSNPTDTLADQGAPSHAKPKRRRAKTSQEGDTSPEGRPRKRRSQTQPRDESGADADESPSETAGRKRRGKSRAPSVPPFDPDADPGEELDPTTVTMSSLCDDLGQGRVSSKAAQIISNHAAWRAVSKEKRARLRAIAEAKKYGRSIDDEDQPVASTSEDPAGGRSPPEDGQAGDDFDYSQHLAKSRYNVQVRVGANGETIIDEESLFVNRDEEEDTTNYTHVEESDTTKFVNSLSYTKKPRGSRWSAEETDLFYDALSQFGENYELISYVLPGRDRKACKNKFKAEDKKNPAKITFCLNHRKPFDIQTLARMTGKDFSGPTPEIRAPAALQSSELDTNVQPEAESATKVTRKKSKTPRPKDGEEILGSIEDMDREDSLFGDDPNV
ncbi:uncharacterized protein B0H18DRAFT_970051 [Fomitopsis serialis]|uniref:uncharacterized protein n=1 Tax=Fomitopsis serialis TaxID=139415 RepID=UPI002008CDB6|nr:uncharacterized protein B0H18DRAFT_970051 [Neoantrodia serialis]KAH9937315.1 hypothetical protein B0H18DRAFT_970051 [Neoantrodia serialis]